MDAAEARLEKLARPPALLHGEEEKAGRRGVGVRGGGGTRGRRGTQGQYSREKVRNRLCYLSRWARRGWAGREGLGRRGCSLVSAAL
jgi:hypothetical protein